MPVAFFERIAMANGSGTRYEGGHGIGGTRAAVTVGV